MGRKIRLRAGPGARLAVALVLVALALWYGSREGPAIEGPARVIDGDSLNVAATEVRLYGMDALEHHQTCLRDGREWRCGTAATAALRDLAEGREVSCTPRETDRYGRVVAVCRRDGIDLGEHMVEAGLAVALSAYGAAERAAREGRRGIWASEFERPAAWRARHPRAGS